LGRFSKFLGFAKASRRSAQDVMLDKMKEVGFREYVNVLNAVIAAKDKHTRVLEKTLTLYGDLEEAGLVEPPILPGSEGNGDYSDILVGLAKDSDMIPGIARGPAIKAIKKNAPKINAYIGEIVNSKVNEALEKEGIKIKPDNQLTK